MIHLCAGGKQFVFMKNDIHAETSECYSTFVDEFTVNTLSVESTCSINLLKFVNWNI